MDMFLVCLFSTVINVANARSFFDWMKENKSEATLLSNMEYCTFGLGDHNYVKYQAAAIVCE